MVTNTFAILLCCPYQIISEQCEDLAAPLNGSVRVNKTPAEFSAEYSCNKGFAFIEKNELLLKGSYAIRTCNPNSMPTSSQWLPPKTPKCKGIDDLDGYKLAK